MRARADAKDTRATPSTKLQPTRLAHGDRLDVARDGLLGSGVARGARLRRMRRTRDVSHTIASARGLVEQLPSGRGCRRRTPPRALRSRRRHTCRPRTLGRSQPVHPGASRNPRGSGRPTASTLHARLNASGSVSAMAIASRARCSARSKSPTSRAASAAAARMAARSGCVQPRDGSSASSGAQAQISRRSRHVTTRFAARVIATRASASPEVARGSAGWRARRGAAGRPPPRPARTSASWISFGDDRASLDEARVRRRRSRRVARARR